MCSSPPAVACGQSGGLVRAAEPPARPTDETRTRTVAAARKWTLCLTLKANGPHNRSEASRNFRGAEKPRAQDPACRRRQRNDAQGSRDHLRRRRLSCGHRRRRVDRHRASRRRAGRRGDRHLSRQRRRIRCSPRSSGRASRAWPSSSWPAATARTTRTAVATPGVDDYIDKPFDTQALIEKVKKALVARETREAAKPAPAPAPASTFQQSHAPRPPAPAAPAPASLPGAAGKAAWPDAAHPHALVRGRPAGRPAARRPAGRARRRPQASAAGPACRPHRRSPVPRLPSAPVAAPVAPVPSPAAAAIATANGQLAGKLGDLGLTSAAGRRRARALARGRRARRVGGRASAGRSAHQGRDRAADQRGVRAGAGAARGLT